MERDHKVGKSHYVRSHAMVLNLTFILKETGNP